MAPSYLACADSFEVNRRDNDARFIVCLCGASPCKGKTRQARAAPRVREAGEIKALKGRNNYQIESCALCAHPWPESTFLFRAFSAPVLLLPCSWGVAPGCLVCALSARISARIEQKSSFPRRRKSSRSICEIGISDAGTAKSPRHFRFVCKKTAHSQMPVSNIPISQATLDEALAK